MTALLVPPPPNQRAARAEQHFASTKVIRVDLQRDPCLIPGLFASRRGELQLGQHHSSWAMQTKLFHLDLEISLSEVQVQMHPGIAPGGTDKGGRGQVREGMWPLCREASGATLLSSPTELLCTLAVCEPRWPHIFISSFNIFFCPPRFLHTSCD